MRTAEDCVDELGEMDTKYSDRLKFVKNIQKDALMSNVFSDYVMALGMLTTLKGDMVIDADEPMRMASEICNHVKSMEDRIKKLENPNLDYS
jgi:hypothetical protein